MTVSGRGDFFAVDARSWLAVCGLGLNEAVAYLVLARGSGRDQRTTAWSVNAIEQYTGISRIRGNAAIRRLIAAGCISQTQAGRKPRYVISSAFEVPGTGAGPPAALTGQEKRVFDMIAAGKTRPPVNGTAEWSWGHPREVASDLVRSGHLLNAGADGFKVKPYDKVAAEKPDWIWLPNTIVDGAAGEKPPVELLRQAQRIDALRLFIELYGEHNLLSDGGIHWRTIREDWNRERVGEFGAQVVWAFSAAGQVNAWKKPMVARFMTGKKVNNEGGKRDAGWSAFWSAWGLLKSLGLIEIRAHVIEDDTDTAEILHPFLVQAGGKALNLGLVAHEAAQSIIMEYGTAAIRKRIEKGDCWLLPANAHLTNVQVVGIARLTYRPRTAATAAWLDQDARWSDWLDHYEMVKKGQNAISR